MPEYNKIGDYSQYDPNRLSEDDLNGNGGRRGRGRHGDFDGDLDGDRVIDDDLLFLQE